MDPAIQNKNGHECFIGTIGSKKHGRYNCFSTTHHLEIATLYASKLNGQSPLIIETGRQDKVIFLSTNASHKLTTQQLRNGSLFTHSSCAAVAIKSIGTYAKQLQKEPAKSSTHIQYGLQTQF